MTRIRPAQIQPGTAGQVIKTVTGQAVWAADVGAYELHAFSKPGPQVAMTGTHRLYMERPGSVVGVRASLSEAPTGLPFKVDTNKNGTTIFTTQSNQPTIAIGAFTDKADAVEVAAFVAGDYFTVDVDQVGSTIPGSDLVVTLEVVYT